MLEAPDSESSAATREAFAKAWAACDMALLPEHVPRWLFLQWLAEQGYLLHGSQQGDITQFEPRTPFDFSPDEFSKRTGVFAASDGIWAMMYALKDRGKVKRILNLALQFKEAADWSPTVYFLSFSLRELSTTTGHEPLTSGFVYVLPSAGFEQMPAYDWPELGTVLEPHWVNPNPVTPLLCIPVTPADFPLPVRLHDAARVDALCADDPWGFPWLDE
ncbi:hypothetical protein FNU79_11375 [Deinococcus detaillensis]|uniref:Uncharacterized protein n=2 Tax=Deinococcus detaillensis TaxID=2592048 RepID=A0A553UUN9_9DEIO|nr:hypothetical protein FNU79_11375 [Deinococcus detaillensis]